MTSIFDRIFWYRQSDKRTPKEDYFTEILAAILKTHKNLAKAFIGYLSGCDGIEHVDIETQRNFCGRRPDIYVTARDSTGRHVIILENKIDAPEGKNQLASYMELLKEKRLDTASRTLVYVTKNYGSDFRKKSRYVEFQHFYWHQVYEWIKEWIKEPKNQETGDGELVTELLNLMEDWRMDGEITAKDLRAAVIYHTSLYSGESLFDIMRQAWDQSKIEEVLKRQPRRWSSKNYSECWKYSTTLTDFKIWIGMGYWFNREDETWSAARLELPSAAVAIYPAAGFQPAKLKRPSGAWTDDSEYTGYAGYECLWVKVLNETPCYGTSLSDFYLEFFLGAFSELKRALHRAQNSTA